MTDVFEEVEENIRQERMASMLRKYGPWAAGLFALILLGVGGYEAWKFWQGRAADTQSAALVEAQKLVETGDFEAAEKAFAEAAASGAAGPRAAAEMQRASALVAQGKLEDALKAFDSAAGMTREPLLRDSARLRAAYLAADVEDFAAIEARLKPMIDEGSAYAALARELYGMEAMEAGKDDVARDQFTAVTLTLDAPEGVRQRAQAALALLGPKPAAAAAPAPPAAGEPASAPASAPAAAAPASAPKSK